MYLIVQNMRNGMGIGALRDFAPAESLYEVTGKFLTCDEDEEIDERTRSNTFRYDEDQYISPAGTIGDFQNHSCSPNAKVVKRDDRLFVVAAAHIRAGEEVVIDYSTIIGADDVWEMTCHCGTAACRGVIRSFDTLPAMLQRQYTEHGMVPRYILEAGGPDLL